MTWATFYLVCFLIGVMLSVLSFVGGAMHLPHLHLHVPHVTPPVHIPHAAGPAHATGVNQSTDVSFLNFGTITIFLAWFGGTGYVLTRYSTLVAIAVMLIAGAAGLAGAAILFWFVVKFLLRHDRQLDPADYDRVGVLGRVTSGIRAGGTGEIVFSQQGTRHTCGARAESGEPLEHGAEVVVTRYERGIAYVRRWEELSGDRD